MCFLFLWGVCARIPSLGFVNQKKIFFSDKYIHLVEYATGEVIMRGYKPTHINHPMVVWAASSLGNYRWTVRHGLALCSQYTLRYQKTHATNIHLQWLSAHEPSAADFLAFVVARQQQSQPVLSSSSPLKKKRGARSKKKVSSLPAVLHHVESFKMSPVRDDAQHDLSTILLPTPPPQCMPDMYRCYCCHSLPANNNNNEQDCDAHLKDSPFHMAVCAYRRYYIYDKSRFAQWNHATLQPAWWLTVSSPFDASLHYYEHHNLESVQDSSCTRNNNTHRATNVKKEEATTMMQSEHTTRLFKKRKRTSESLSSPSSCMEYPTLITSPVLALETTSTPQEMQQQQPHYSSVLSDIPCLVVDHIVRLDDDAWTFVSPPTAAFIEEPRLAIYDNADGNQNMNLQQQLWDQSDFLLMPESVELSSFTTTTTTTKRQKIAHSKGYMQYVRPLYCATLTDENCV